jgi:O-antigen/teichoic acid export membrane protein
MQINLSSRISFKIVYYFVSQLAERFLAFLSLILIAKQFQPDGYGIWTQFLTTASIAVAILTSGVSAFIIQVNSQFFEKYFRRKLYQYLLLCIILLILIFIINQFLRNRFAYFIFSNDVYNDLFLLLLVYIFSEICLEVVIAILRTQNRVVYTSNIYLIKVASRLVIISYMFNVDSLSFNVYFFSFIFLNFCILFFSIFRLSQNFLNQNISFQHSDQHSIRHLVKFFLSLTFISLLYASNNFLNRYILVHQENLFDLGSYSLSYTFASTLSLIYSSIGFVLYPIIATHITDLNYIKLAIDKYIVAYTTVSIILISLYFALGPTIIVFFSSPEYETNRLNLLLLTTAVFLFGFHQLIAYILIVKKDFRTIIKMLLITNLFNIPVTLIMVQLLGLLGASLSLFICNLTLFLLTLNYFRNRINWLATPILLLALKFIFMYLTSYFVVFYLYTITRSSILSFSVAACLITTIIYIDLRKNSHSLLRMVLDEA